MAIAIKLASDLTQAARARFQSKNQGLDTSAKSHPLHGSGMNINGDPSQVQAALRLVKEEGTPAQAAAAQKYVNAHRPGLGKIALSLPKPGFMGRMSNALQSDHGGHLTELAGLGVLAVPAADHIQAHTRAALAGDHSPEAIQKRQLIGDVGHAGMEIGGLGVLAAPSALKLMKPSALDLMKHAMFDELKKVGAVSQEQAEHAVDRLETLERNKPTAAQVGRYAAFGAVAAPAVTAVSHLVKGNGPRNGLTGVKYLRDVAGDAAKGGISGGLLPLAQREMDRRAEEGTLRDYLKTAAEKDSGFFDAIKGALSKPIPGTGRMPVIGGAAPAIQGAVRNSSRPPSGPSAGFQEFQKKHRSMPPSSPNVPISSHSRGMASPPPMRGRVPYNGPAFVTL